MCSNNNLGKAMRRFRDEKKRTQKEVAAALSISQTYYSNWECGKSIPSREYLIAFADYLRLDDKDKDYLLITAGHVPEETDIKNDLDSEAWRIIAAVLFDAESSKLVTPPGERPLIIFANSWAKITEAKRAKRARNWDETIKICDEAISEVKRAALIMQAYLHDDKGSSQLHQGDIKAARKTYNYLSSIVDDLDDPYIRGKIFTHGGELHRDLCEWKPALENFNAAKNEFMNIDDQEKSAWVERKLGLTHLLMGNIIEARMYLNSSEDWLHSSGNDNKYELAKIKLAKGWIHAMIGEWDKACAAREDGLRLANEFQSLGDNSDPYLVMQANLYLGYDYRTIGERKKAIKHLKEAESISEDLRELRDRGSIYLGLARLFLEEGNFSAADEYFQLSAEGYGHWGNKVRQGMTQLFWGESFIRRGDDTDYIKAQQILNGAKSIFKLLEHNYYLARVHTCLSELYLLKRKAETTEDGRNTQRLKDSIEFGIEYASRGMQPYHQPLAHLWAYKGQAAIEIDNNDKWVEYFAKSLDHAVRFNVPICESVGKIIHNNLCLLFAKSSARTQKTSVLLRQAFETIELPADDPITTRADVVRRWLAELEKNPRHPLKFSRTNGA